MADFVALSELVDALRNASVNRKSGAFFITSREQHSAMVTLAQGRVTGVKYRNKRGAEAAEAIAGLEAVRFQTSSDLTELPGQSDLNTDQILDLLAGEAGGGTSAQSGSAASGSEASGGDEPINDDRLESIRERYISAIGPIGGAIFDEERDSLGDRVHTDAGLNELVDQLAAQIDAEADANSVRSDVGSS